MKQLQHSSLPPRFFVLCVPELRCWKEIGGHWEINCIRIYNYIYIHLYTHTYIYTHTHLCNYIYINYMLLKWKTAQHFLFTCKRSINKWTKIAVSEEPWASNKVSVPVLLDLEWAGWPWPWSLFSSVKWVQCPKPHYAQCGPWTSSLSITGERVRTTES